MNKKNLSVVMAGAMLATSVAPVLAETTNNVTDSYKKLLASNVEAKMKEKEISTNAAIKDTSKGYVSQGVSNLMNSGKSAYGVKVIGNDGTVKKINSYEISYDIAAVKNYIENDIVAGDTIEIYERENTNFYGEIIPGTEITVKSPVYVSDIDSYISELRGSSFVSSVTKNKDGVSATVKLKALSDIKDPNSNITFEVRAGEVKLDVNLPLDSEGNVTDNVQKCVKFAEKNTYKVSQVPTEEPTLVETIKVTEDVKDNEIYDVADLYDGFAFTSKGTEIMDMINNKDKYPTVKYNVTTLDSYETTPGDFDDTKSSTIVSHNGVYSVKIAILDTKGRLAREVSVVSSDSDAINGFFKLLGGEYKVGVVAGDNRYETAVNVDKAIKRAPLNTTTTTGKSDIVLVNGESLVDGLAAAPLAASLKWNGGTNFAAPVLLSKTDSLPTETKEYIEELSNNVAPAARKNITINLVGGESVLSETLVKELEDMGFSVVRYGGDNREETSLEVAEAINSKSTGYTEAFVVGGNGEADAMSIAAVAADTKAPIIVSSVNGLSKDAVRFIDRNFDTKDLTIVGGEAVVSKDEETKIDEAITNPVKRIAGNNRFETNAKVIKEYKVGSADSVVAVKDGLSNESELVDALSAANYAAATNAQLVLASSSVKDSQKNALLNSVTKGGTSKVVQVGNGAERSVLVTLANLFGLKNN